MALSKELIETAKRIGMTISIDYTELIENPTDITKPEVIERMMHVITTTHEAPSAIDQLNDFDLGNMVRMLTRTDLYHEPTVVAARNRIWKLSKALQVMTVFAEVFSEQGKEFNVHDLITQIAIKDAEIASLKKKIDDLVYGILQ